MHLLKVTKFLNGGAHYEKATVQRNRLISLKLRLVETIKIEIGNEINRKKVEKWYYRRWEIYQTSIFAVLNEVSTICQFGFRTINIIMIKVGHIW